MGFHLSAALRSGEISIEELREFAVSSSQFMPDIRRRPPHVVFRMRPLRKCPRLEPSVLNHLNLLEKLLESVVSTVLHAGPVGVTLVSSTGTVEVMSTPLALNTAVVTSI